MENQILIGMDHEKWSEEDCRDRLAQMRWPDGVVCPHCDDSGRISRLESRPLWWCGDCKSQFSAKVGTVFEGSPIPLLTWFTAIRLLASRKGISLRQLCAEIGVTPKTARFMLSRLRRAMPDIGGNGSLVRKPRPWIGKKFLGRDVTLEICVKEGTFRVPHDDLHAWVGKHKTALETSSWKNRGTYHWPHTPKDMLAFLEKHRVIAGGIVRHSIKKRVASRSKLDPPDISADVVDLVRIAVRHCRLPHPDVVRRIGGAVFPVVRSHKKRGKTGTIKGRRIMYDDNASPRWALLWSHGFDVIAHPEGWMFAHVWDNRDNPEDPDAYTHLANLAMMPESFGDLSDKQGPLVQYLRHHAQEVYGWRPASKDPVEKPYGYDDLEWNYLDSIADPKGFICKQMARSKDQRVIVLRDLLNWY